MCIHLVTSRRNLHEFYCFWATLFIFLIHVVDPERAVFDSTTKIDILVTWFVVNAVNTQVVFLIRIKGLVEHAAELLE